MRDLGIINSDEPFISLLSQGMVLQNGQKMSKSKGNTIDPDDIIKKYGADTIRLYIMFSAPPEQSLEWSDSAIEGSFKFLKRLWALTYKITEISGSKNENLQDIKFTKTKIHKTIKKVSLDIFERHSYNTAIASIMELQNELIKHSNSKKPDYDTLLEGIEVVLKMLSPIVPHITQELWRSIGMTSNLSSESWPRLDEEMLVEYEKEIIVQVNGKLRGKLLVRLNQSEEEIVKVIKSTKDIYKHIEGSVIIKTIYIKEKLINYVLKK